MLKLSKIQTSELNAWESTLSICFVDWKDTFHTLEGSMDLLGNCFLYSSNALWHPDIFSPPAQQSCTCQSLWLHFFETVPLQQTGERCFARPHTLARHERFKDTWFSFTGSAQRSQQLYSLGLTPCMIGNAFCHSPLPWSPRPAVTRVQSSVATVTLTTKIISRLNPHSFLCPCSQHLTHLLVVPHLMFFI